MNKALHDIEFCISIRQPWTELVLSGAKPHEVRRWRPKDSFCGRRVAIHSGLAIDKRREPWRHLTPERAARARVQTGMILGAATLAGIVPYRDYGEFCMYQPLHLNPPEWYEDGLFGFVFTDPVYIEPVPYRGQLGFFRLIGVSAQKRHA